MWSCFSFFPQNFHGHKHIFYINCVQAVQWSTRRNDWDKEETAHEGVICLCTWISRISVVFDANLWVWFDGLLINLVVRVHPISWVLGSWVLGFLSWEVHFVVEFFLMWYANIKSQLRFVSMYELIWSYIFSDTGDKIDWSDGLVRWSISWHILALVFFFWTIRWRIYFVNRWAWCK